MYLAGISSPQFPFGIPNQSTGTITCSGSLIINITSNTSINLFAEYTGGSGLVTIADNKYTATRIA